MNNIEIIDNVGESFISDNIVKFVNTVLVNLECDNWELPISFVNSDVIKDLNKKYRDVNFPTDVITFNAYENGNIPNNEIIFPGDIVICLSEIKNNCLKYNVEFYEELQRVLIHSILHLLGWTHDSYDFINEKMLVKQENLLTTIIKSGDFRWEL